jgi:hypothetical protein
MLIEVILMQEKTCLQVPNSSIVYSLGVMIVRLEGVLVGVAMMDNVEPAT